MANLATRGGVEGTNPIRIRTPLIDLTKAQIIRRGLELGVDYAITQSCYDPDRIGRGVRALRRLSAAAEGSPRPDGRPRTVCGAVAILRRDVHGQRDFLHAAGRRGERRARRRVLPLLRLQPVDGARGRSRDGRLRLLRHRLRRRRTRRRQVRERRRARRAQWRLAGRSRYGDTASSSARAASRCSSSTPARSRRSTPQASRSRSRRTARRIRPPGSTGFASAPRPGPNCGFDEETS